MGVCVEDPLLSRSNFVTTAAVGDLEGVRQLLQRGEDPNAADLSGNSALALAASNRHPEIVELLVEAGATVNCRDRNVRVVLHYISFPSSFLLFKLFFLLLF